MQNTIRQLSWTILIFCVNGIWNHQTLAQYYREHHIAPAPWQYWHDANEFVLATPSDTTIYIEISKSDGTHLATLTSILGSPAVFRPTGNFKDFTRHPMDSKIKGAGIMLKSNGIFSVNIRNIASDQLGTDAFIKGNASLTSLGNPGIGLAFRLGYYRDGPLPSELPVYSIMSLYNQTQVSINGIVSFELQAGESYLFRQPIGTLVEATKPCVMNTSAFLDAPGGCGDGTFDQIPPVNSLGNRYFIVRTQGNGISEQTTLVATVDSTHLVVNRYNASGNFLTTSSHLIPLAGGFLTIANGDGTTPFSVAEINSNQSIAVFTGSAQSCEVDVSSSFPISSPCNGSNFIETSFFKAYRGNNLPYFCYILLEDANAEIDFNGTDIESIVSKRRQIGTTNWYMINLNSSQVGNPQTISISSAVKLYVAIIQIGGGFSMSATFSNLVDQPPVPNVLYIKHGQCPASNVLLTAGNGSSNYQWYLNGNAIAGANDSFLITTEAGVYQIGSLLACGEYQVSAPVPVVFDSLPHGFMEFETCNLYHWHDSTYRESGTYTKLLQNEKGCDSLATLKLIIHKVTQSSMQVATCEEFTWPVNGKTYKLSGIYRDTLINQNGCDSVLVLHLNILQSSKFSWAVEACKNYTWPITGMQYDKSGIYRDTLVNHLGCDSIRELSLKILDASFQNISIESCSEYTWPVNGETYHQSGVYLDTFFNKEGCDSIWMLDLKILYGSKNEETVKVCRSYKWSTNDSVYYQSGIYSAMFSNSYGCDSIRVLYLEILESSRDTQRAEICNAYYWPLNGKRFTHSGVYTDTLVNHLGCDSIVVLSLAVYKDYKHIDTQRHCREYYWEAAQKFISTSGDYQLDLKSRNGCDSILQLNLIIDPEFFSADTLYVFGDYFWPVTKTLYDKEGVYEFHLQTERGCDSLYVLVLNILKRGDVFIPNVFTPNGDGVNDRFIVFATPEIHEILRLRIYDRWGQLVFEHKRFSPNEFAYGWNGLFNGQKANPAVFFCTVEWEDAAGELHLLSGDVTLIR